MSRNNKHLKKLNECSVCDYKGEETHLHHIIPKSLGGKDTAKNLVELCLICHGKAHNISAKGESGLIKTGIKRTEDNFDGATKWLNKHKTILQEFISDFSDYLESNILEDLLYFNVIKANELHTWIKFGKSDKLRGFGDIPHMVNSFYENNANMYNIDLTEDFSKF